MSADGHGSRLDMGGVLRERLQKPGILVVPGVTDAITARLAVSLGFEAVYLGGYAMGQVLGMTEPLMTLTETADYTRHIAAAAGVPVILDGNAGFGDDLHTKRSMEVLARAGAAAIHVEDQHFPKRARYFEGHKYVLDRDTARRKFLAAKEGLRGTDVVLIGRTDAREAQGGGLDEAIARCRLFIEHGAEIVMPYATCAPTRAEAESVARDLSHPMLYVSSEGKTEHARLSADELGGMGWKVVIFNLVTLMASVAANRDALRYLREHGRSHFDMDDAARVRAAVEDVSGLPAMYEVERRVDDLYDPSH